MKAIRRPALVCLALAAAVIAVYWTVVGHEFIALDDPQFITSNPDVISGLSWDGLRWAFDNRHWSWHPLTWISHQLDCELFGLDPVGHHLENVALHLANVLLVLFVTRSLTGSFWRSALLAALFGLHPLCVEAVAWAADRKGLLSTLFGMLTIGAYARYARVPSARRYSLVVLLFALCLLSKAMLITLPLLLLMLDFWPLRRHVGSGSSVRRLLLEKIPLLLLAVAPALLATRADPEPIPAGLRLANGVVSYSRYLEKMLWPFDLAVPYPYPDAWPAWRVLLALATIAAVSVYAWRSARRHPYVAFGWLWYLVSLLPVIGIIQSGVQSMADRFTYVPMIGILTAVVWRIEAAARSRPASVRRWIVVALVVAVAWGVRSADQLHHWSNTRALFEHAVRVTRDNFRAHSILGAAYLKAGDLKRAGFHLSAALRIRPDEPEVRLGLGNLSIARGEPDRAIRQLRRAVTLEPSYPNARTALGLALFKTGRLAAAAEQYRAAIELDPRDPVARLHLAALHTAQGDDRIASEELARILRAYPEHPEANRAMAEIMIRRRQMSAAGEHLSTALRTSPDDPWLLLSLARILAVFDDDRVRDGARALELARRACELTGFRSPEALDVLASALAATGRFEEAARAAADASALARASGNEALAAEAHRRSEQFRRGQAHRQR